MFHITTATLMLQTKVIFGLVKIFRFVIASRNGAILSLPRRQIEVTLSALKIMNLIDHHRVSKFINFY